MRQILRNLLPFVIVLGLALVGCAPQLQPQTERDGEEVIITITVNEPIYAATMSVLRADSNDERCIEAESNSAHLVCDLGDLYETTTVGVVGVDVTCVVFGHTGPVQTLQNYRAFPCKTGG